MKRIMLAAIAAFSISGAAFAETTFVGSAEYTVEAENFETTAGMEFTQGGFTVTPLVTMNDNLGDFDFSSAEVTVAYDINKNVATYVTVETDEDFDYAETTVGVAVRF